MRQILATFGSSFFFSTRTGLDSQSGCSTSMMKPEASSRVISSPITFLLSSERRRIDCFTGFISGLTNRECSANSLGTPGKSKLDHAKMSRFSRRKLVSSLSYLSLNPAPMMTLRSGNSGSTLTFFVSLGAWNVAPCSGLTYPGIPGMPACAD